MRHRVWYALSAAAVAALLAACGSTATGGSTSTSSTMSASSTPTRCSVTTGLPRPTNSVCSNSGAGGTSAPAAGRATSFMLDGTYHGRSLTGLITGVTVQCTPISTGTSSGVQVVWNGVLYANGGATEKASGDMSIPQYGSFAFPNTDPKTPTASLVIADDEQGRYGLSGGQFGIGSGGLSATTSGGSINAAFAQGGNGSEDAKLSGSWAC